MAQENHFMAFMAIIMPLLCLSIPSKTSSAEYLLRKWYAIISWLKHGSDKEDGWMVIITEEGVPKATTVCHSTQARCLEDLLSIVSVFFRGVTKTSHKSRLLGQGTICVFEFRGH